MGEQGEHGTGAEVDAGAPIDLGGHLAEVEKRLEEAVAAAERLRLQLGDGRTADPADIDAVTGFTEALRSAQSAAAQISDAGPPESVDQLRQIVREIEKASVEHETTVFVESLRAIAEMPDDQAAAAAVKACKEMARALSEPGALDDPEARRRAAGLHALIQLNRVDGQDDRKDLEKRATESLPQECIPAVGLADAGLLRFEPASSDEAESPLAPTDDEDGGGEETPATVEAEDVASADAAQPPAPEPGPASDSDLEAVVKRLLREGRFGLAHWVVVSSHGDRGLEKALIALAYADAMRSPVGESAGRLRELIDELAPEGLHGDEGARLIVLVAGLRATLLAPHSGAAGLLEMVAASFTEPAGLGRFVEAVADAGRRGLSATNMTEQVQTISTTEGDLSAVRARAQEMLKLRTIKYQRATNVWRKWIEGEGLVGSLLNDVVADKTELLDEVERKVFDLRSAKTLEKKLDETDRTLKAAGRQKPIIAKARYKLVELAEEALNIAADWVDVSRRLQRKRQDHASASWQKSLLDDLRSVALEAREEIGTAWDAWSEGTDLHAAAAAGTKPIVEEIFRLVVEGESVSGPEQQVDEILGLDLLRVDGLVVDDRLNPLDIPPLRPLLHAVDSDDWESAFERRTREGSFGIAARIVEVARRESADGADRLEALRIERLEDERGHLNGRLREAARTLEAARRQGRLLEQDALDLSNELNELTLDDDQEELGGVDEAISGLQAKLEKAEQVGLARAHEKYAEPLKSDPALQPYRERFELLLEGGQISTLEELVLAVERGGEPPSEPQALFKQLTEFFPVVVEDPTLSKLPDPAELAELVSQRGELGTLSFAGLRDEEQEAVQGALLAWRRLAKRDFKQGDEDLAQVLDFLGLTVQQDLDLKLDSKSTRGSRSFPVNATPLGGTLIPAFGSEAKGRYRVLMIWQRMTDDALVGALSQVPGDQPVVVLCLGSVLSATVRRGIADQLRHRRFTGAAAFIDEAAFLYIASRGGRNPATTMRIALPFTAINPYTPFVPGSVPLEMFYGRHSELADVINPNGTSFIYGGRRLGKSALLRAAERKLNAEGGGQKALYIDLKSNGIGEWRLAEEIVDVIIRALIEGGVMTSTAGKSESPSFDLVREQVIAWLDIDPDRRILLLLDECDSFLNADAEDGFRGVSQLKALMEETDRRFKPVFAGLHQVNRFQRMPNQPLAHLGGQVPVGPLAPQHAYELITKPLEALGYRFEDDSGLPERILTATNYQPSLIQLFCSELIKHMLGRARGPETPPYPITSADVEHVYQAPHVVEEMRKRFVLTISLDPRYSVIAYVVALEAREGGLSVGLAPPEIRAACEEYWPAGFASTGSDEFRTLLEEMDSLGILFEREGTFLMRSPNVLRMLGTGEQIEERLYDAADELELEQGFEATSFRGSMGDDGYRRRPLTHQQVAGMLERGRHVRVVVGSQATNVDDVPLCLKELFDSEAGTFNFVDLSDQVPKRVATHLRKPRRKKHRVVHYRVPPNAPGDGLDLLHTAEDKIFNGESDSTAIFVIGADALPWWRAAIAPESDLGAIDAETESRRFEVVELRRWTEAGLRAWAQSQEVELPFHDKQALKELMQATGGWPMLVDRVVTSYAQKRNWRKAIEELEAWLDGPDGASALCEAIGLTHDPTVSAAWNMLVELGEPVERELFQELIEGDVDAAIVSALLRSMQVLELDSDGRFVAERTAARAWRTSRQVAVDAGV